MKLFLGPYSPPITGQSISFRDVYNSYNRKKVLIDSTRFGKRRYWNTIYVVLVSFLLKIRYPKAGLYFTLSRTKHGFLKEFPILFFNKLLASKSIAHVHGLGIENFHNSIPRIFKNLVYTIDTAIVLFKGSIKEFRPFFKGSIYHVNNWYEPTVNSNGSIAKKDQILFLSNIMASKGIILFLDSCELIFQRDSTVNVCIGGIPIGDHIMSESEIRCLFDERLNDLQNKFPNRIHYYGEVKGGKKEILLNESKMFILPTYHPTEAQPISIIEAMYHKCAIITSNHNYLPEMISTSNGIILEKNDPLTIAEAVLDLLNENVKINKMGTENKKLALDKYDRRKNIQRVIEIIDSHS